MKLQLKLDKDSLQQFFLDHTEKIVFGVVVVAFFLVPAYQAANHKGYKDQPDRMKESVRVAEQNIAKPLEFKPDAPGFRGPNDPGYEEVVKRAPGLLEVVSDGNFRVYTPYSIVRQTRGMPAVYQVANLRGTAGRGKVAMNPRNERPAAKRGERERPGQGPDVAGLRWILITGRVPIKDQTDEYVRVFKDAALQDPKRDVPEYAGFFVERVEVSADSTAQGDPSKPEFWNKAVRFSTFHMLDAVKSWGSDRSRDKELTDPRCIHPRLSSPLPPRVDGQWGPEVRDPEIPVLTAEEAAGARGRGETPGHRATPPPARSREDKFGPDLGDEFLTPGKSDDTKPSPDAKPEAEKDSQPRYLLFRFFDFSVEPNKQYCYRVFLMLKNPNAGLELKHVSDPEFVKPLFIGVSEFSSGANGTSPELKIAKGQADWSKPSAPIYVPEDIRVLASSVTPSLVPGREPVAEIQIEKWLEKEGIQATKKFSVQRGTVANFYNESVGGDKPKTKGVRGKQPVPESATVDFVTDEVVVDIAGGEKVTGPRVKPPLTRPAQVLMLDRAGNLMFHDALADQASLETNSEPPPGDEPPPKRKMEGGGLDSDIFKDEGKRPPGKPRARNGG